MSMTPEEQIAVAVKCGAAELKSYASTTDGQCTAYLMTGRELATYTAAVEAKERERCAVVCDSVGDGPENGCCPTFWNDALEKAQAAIRSLK